MNGRSFARTVKSRFENDFVFLELAQTRDGSLHFARN